jgi:tRNA1(Val) A37 N6-methylase TrmN6
MEYFGAVRASDVHDYGHGEVENFLFPGDYSTDWIITNPPFRLAEQFALTARERAREGVALLVRTTFLESGGRFANLFSKYRPNAVLQFSERVPMHKGRLIENGSTATAYCWIV